MKWMMGWMHDTLEYFKKEPVYRQHHQGDITFSMTYAFTENFMLPFSHDEVVYGKQSLLYRMPGDEWQRFGNLRLLFGYMFTHPGTNLIFMGGEFGQSSEWNFQQSLDWHLLQYDYHRGVQNLVRDMNALYQGTPALFERDFVAEGFEWIEWNDRDASTLSWIRRDAHGGYVICITNFTPVVRYDYRVGVSEKRPFEEILNTDADIFGGSGIGNDDLLPDDVGHRGKPHALSVTIPPLAASLPWHTQQRL